MIAARGATLQTTFGQDQTSPSRTISALPAARWATMPAFHPRMTPDHHSRPHRKSLPFVGLGLAGSSAGAFRCSALRKPASAPGRMVVLADRGAVAWFAGNPCRNGPRPREARGRFADPHWGRYRQGKAWGQDR